MKKAITLLVLAGALAGYFSLSESTRRYLKHLCRQAPHLPYRYFI